MGQMFFHYKLQFTDQGRLGFCDLCRDGHGKSTHGNRLVHIVFGTAAASLVVTMAGFASIRDGFQELLVPLAVILFGGGLTAMLLARRSRTGSPAPSTSAAAALHPGITMHAIPVSGAMGALFTAGYVFMFWFGLPGISPVVVGLAVVGILLGGFFVLVVERRDSKEPDGKLLHLER